WIDKDDTSKRPETTEYKPRLEFYILDKGQKPEEVPEGTKYTELTAENMKQVGLGNIDKLITIEESGNHWQATANLPTSIHYGDNQNNSREVVWKYVPDKNIPYYTWWDTTTGQDPD